MDSKDLIPVVASIFSSGLVAAVVTFLLNRSKNIADIEKIKADTEVSRLNAKKIAADLSAIEKSQVMQQNDLRRLSDVTNDLLNNLAIFSLAGYMYGHLQHLFYAQRNRTTLKYDRVDDHLRRELLFLADNGYIEHMEFWELTAEDVAQKIKLTPAGQWLVQLREEREGRSIPT